MRRLFVLLVAGLAVAVFAGCGDDSDGASESTENGQDQTEEEPADAPRDEEAARAAINDAYACFLDGSLGYTFEQKAECVVGVLDDPELFALFESTGEANAPTAAMTAAEIGGIEFRDAESAAVDFDLVVGGDVLEGIAPPGGAVLVEEEGEEVWKVSTLTFCNLTALQNPTVASEGPCAEVIREDRI